MINVPLGKAATQRTDFPLSPPEFPPPNRFNVKQLEQPQNYWQFLKNIMDSGSFVHTGFQEVTGTDDTITDITPPNGSTFYFLGANILNQTSDIMQFQLRIVIDGSTTILDQMELADVGGRVMQHMFNLQFGSVIGTGRLNRFEIHVTNPNSNPRGASMWGYLADTAKLSSRIKFV